MSTFVESANSSPCTPQDWKTPLTGLSWPGAGAVLVRFKTRPGSAEGDPGGVTAAAGTSVGAPEAGESSTGAAFASGWSDPPQAVKTATQESRVSTADVGDTDIDSP